MNGVELGIELGIKHTGPAQIAEDKQISKYIDWWVKYRLNVDPDLIVQDRIVQQDNK